MEAYTYFDLTIASELPLPELRSCNDGEADCRFTVDASRSPSKSYQWFHHWHDPDGNIELSCAWEKRRLRLRFADQADFLVSADGSIVHCIPSSSVSVDTVRHLLLNQVLPRVLNYRGRLVLHASVVQTSEGAIAFLGDSSWGKSTLAASFVASGDRLIADDGLILDEDASKVNVIVGQEALRLWSDSVFLARDRMGSTVAAAVIADDNDFAKQTVVLDESRAVSPGSIQPLKCIFLLASPDESNFAISTLLKSDAVMALTRHSFRLDVSNLQRTSEDFLRFCKVVEMVPVFRLAFPREYRYLPKIREEVLLHLRKIGRLDSPEQRHADTQ